MIPDSREFRHERPAQDDGGRVSARVRPSLGQELRATILASADETEGRHDLVVCAQPYGQATPLHLHTRYEERLWVASGSMTVWAGAETVTLGSGDYYAIPMHVPHAIQAGRQAE
jgi:mannose-6-phosphate isomerase-like protein (cupin superfamily)